MASALNVDLERNKAVVRQFDDLGNGNGDMARLEELCTPDMVNHMLAPGRPQGIEGTREFLLSARRDLNPARWVESHLVSHSLPAEPPSPSLESFSVFRVVTSGSPARKNGLGRSELWHTPCHDGAPLRLDDEGIASGAFGRRSMASSQSGLPG